MLSTDVNSPAFSEYSYRLTKASASTGGEFNAQDGFMGVAVESIGSMIKIGQLDSTLSQDEIEFEASGLTPSEGMVQYLVRQTAIETFEHHYTRQTQNLDLTLEPELIWPIAERMYPYT